MRLLFLLLLAATGINAPPASAQSWSDVLVRSRTRPPESYLAVVKALGSLGLRATHDPAWKPTTLCSRRPPDCGNHAFCWGLKRSYATDLRAPGWSYSQTVWGWEYESAERARIAVAADDWLVLRFNVILVQDGPLVIAMRGPGKAPDRARLQAALGRSPVLRPWPPSRATPAPLTVPRTTAALLAPETPDEQAEAVAFALKGRDPSLKVTQLANLRGMRLLSKNAPARAARAFELSVALARDDGDAENDVAIYNRACAAARQGEVGAAVLWLWKLKNPFGPIYGLPSQATSKGLKLLGRVLRDPDFETVRGSAELAVFKRCL